MKREDFLTQRESEGQLSGLFVTGNRILLVPSLHNVPRLGLLNEYRIFIPDRWSVEIAQRHHMRCFHMCQVEISKGGLRTSTLCHLSSLQSNRKEWLPPCQRTARAALGEPSAGTCQTRAGLSIHRHSGFVLVGLPAAHAYPNLVYELIQRFLGLCKANKSS